MYVIILCMLGGKVFFRGEQFQVFSGKKEKLKTYSFYLVPTAKVIRDRRPVFKKFPSTLFVLDYCD